MEILYFTAQGKIDIYAPIEDIEFSYGKFWKISFATPAVDGVVLMLKQWAIVMLDHQLISTA